MSRKARRLRAMADFSPEVEMPENGCGAFAAFAAMSVHEHLYGTPHRRLRRQLAPVVAGGHVKCSRCGEPIAAGEPWDLDHDDFDKSRYLGAAHRRCNRATEPRKRHRTSREW